MKLYSIGQRSYIVDPKQVVKGGVFRSNDLEKKFMYIEPKAKFEVTDEYGKKLMAMYPDQFMQLDETGKPLDPPVKKVKAKKKKVIVKKTAKKTKKR